MNLEPDELDQLSEYHLEIISELAQSIYNYDFTKYNLEKDLNNVQNKLHTMDLSLARCREILKQKRQQKKDGSRES